MSANLRTSTSPQLSNSKDIIIIGGSYAGLSSALALGRSLRNVLVIDSGKPCNRQTPHSQNFLTHDGKTPAEIAALAKADVLKYETVSFFDGLAVSATKTKDGFSVETSDGNRFNSKKIIIATGIRDIMPDIKGVAECWGISVIHCPYCHGYEYWGKRTFALANADAAVHYARLVGNLTDDLTLLTNGPAHFSAEQKLELADRKIGVIETEVIEVIHDKGYISEIILADGTSLKADALYAKLPFEQHSDIPMQLGCTINEMGFVSVDAFQKTTVAGVFACGDCTTPMRSVANSVGTGNFAGAMVNMELSAETIR